MSNFDDEFYLNNLRLLESVYLKAVAEDIPINEGNGHLILEELEQADIEALRKQADDLEKLLKKNKDASSKIDSLSPMTDWLTATLTQVSKAGDLASKLDLGSPKWGDKKKLSKTLKNLAFINQQSAQGIDSFAKATELLARNVKGKVDPTIKFSELPEDGKLTSKDVQSGIQKAFKQKGGFLAKAKGFLKTLGGVLPKGSEEFPKEEIAQALMNLNFNELESLTKTLKSAGETPQVSDDTLRDFAAPAEDLGSPSGEGEDEALDKNEVQKAGKAWLDKLKADGASEALLAIGKKWISAVVKDSKFVKIALSESKWYDIDFLLENKRFLINEKIVWDDLVQVFVANKPQEIKALTPEDVGPLIAPFAQFLADAGLEVVDRNGKPFKIPVEDLEEELDDAEELDPSLADEEGTEDGEGSEEGSEEGASPKWADVSTAVVDALEDKDSARAVLDALAKDNAFKNAMKDKVVFEESIENYSAGSLLGLVFEQVSFEDVKSTAENVVDDEVDAEKVSAEVGSALNDKVGSEVVTGIPSDAGAGDGEEEELSPDDPDAELTPEERAEDDEVGEQIAAQVGSGPIGKTELAAILKKFPDVVGTGQKATRARRKLRKAINTAAGKEIFEESLDLKLSQEKYVLEESNSSDALVRWRKLAGLE